MNGLIVYFAVSCLYFYFTRPVYVRKLPVTWGLAVFSPGNPVSSTSYKWLVWNYAKYDEIGIQI